MVLDSAGAALSINKAQLEALEILADGEWHPSTTNTYDKYIHGGCGKALHAAGLADVTGGIFFKYRITEAGRIALERAKMKKNDLTGAQKVALRALADGEMHETASSSLSSPIARLTGQFLVRQGWATMHFVLADGREISAAERADFEPYEWRLKLRITRSGREQLAKFTGGER